MEYIRNNGTRVIVDGDNVQYGEGKMRKNIIGANFTNGIVQVDIFHPLMDLSIKS